MDRKTSAITLICGLFVLLVFGKAAADEVWLKNGDHISGKLSSLKENTLLFETTYAGTLSTSWKKVANQKTDIAFEGVTGDASRVVVPIAPGLILDAAVEQSVSGNSSVVVNFRCSPPCAADYLRRCRPVPPQPFW